MWQIVQHALNHPENKTKFTLLYGNVEERDVLLQGEFERLSKKYPDTFKVQLVYIFPLISADTYQVVHVLEKAPESWPAPKGYINSEVIKQYVAGPDKNVRVLVCGPPPQVAAIAGKKDGAKQGALGGALKELGYTEEQVYKF